MKQLVLILLLFFGTNCFAQTDSCAVIVPDHISMNCGSGLDFLFRPSFSCPVDSCSLTIYSRWGEVLYTSKILLPVWDANQQQQGIYHYVLKGVYANKQEFYYKGQVLVM